MHKGFTLIEFVVIISIFAIMASVALFNFQGFRSNVAISNLSHDIALTLRQAQVFGWSSQTNTSGTTLIPVIDPNTKNPERYADGVYFAYDPSTSSFVNQFLLYTKTDPQPGLEMYEPTDVINDTIKMQGNVRIVDIRTGLDQATLSLDAAHHIIGGTPIAGSVSIAFSRPRPEALFFNASGLDSNPSDQYMAIYIASTANSDTSFVDHIIFVSRFGEIEVQ